MAQIKFEIGGRFKTKLGYGILLPNNKAFVIEGEGGRRGFQVKKIDFDPADATIIPALPPHEITFGLDCVACAFGIGAYVTS
ncbi:MAG: hypothetical protein KBC33_01520 [Candidatus Pacebacteria bacterium]|nr:hypothetical protein [Candidatus Paceibacterota bacterium]